MLIPLRRRWLRVSAVRRQRPTIAYRSPLSSSPFARLIPPAVENTGRFCQDPQRGGARRFSSFVDYHGVLFCPVVPQRHFPNRRHFSSPSSNPDTEEPTAAAAQHRSELPLQQKQQTRSHQQQWPFFPTDLSGSGTSTVTSTTATPLGPHQHLDFFGEPVSVLEWKDDDANQTTHGTAALPSNVMAAFDAWLLAVVSKGRTTQGQGGGEAGLDMQGPHGVAVSWAEALKFATVWNPLPPKPDGNVKDHGDETNEEASSPRSQNYEQRSIPMLAVVTVAPLLAQAGVAYLRQIDRLLASTKAFAPGYGPIQLYDLASNAVACLGHPNLHEREVHHLQILEALLLQEDHAFALKQCLRLLQICPGDALALSLAMDLAHSQGDRSAAFRAAGSVVSYWHERRGGLIRPAIPGTAMVQSLIALGMAVGGRGLAEAEPMAETAMQQGRKTCGALATWAQVHVLDANGRVAEGISACANHDGMVNYEGAGFLFFDCRLAGYGARFALDREERGGRGQSIALRLYARHFERVLEYSGYAQRQPWNQPQRVAPLSWSEPLFLEGGEEPSSDAAADATDGSNEGFLSQWLRGSTTRKRKNRMEEQYELVVQQDNNPSTRFEGWNPSCEDVLTWLPPSPRLLSDATLLLLRFTLNGTIGANNAKWKAIRNAWEATMDMARKDEQEKTNSSTRANSPSPLSFSPMVCLSASILIPPSETGADNIGGGQMARALHRMGELLELAGPSSNGNKKATDDGEKTTALREIVATRDPNFWLPSSMNEHNGHELANEWKQVVNDFSTALEGLERKSDKQEDRGGSHNDLTNDPNDLEPFEDWVFEARPITEHAVVYAACKAGDIESLSLARSICSLGVTLRPSSPEEWWRYSIVLGLLGDEVAAEDALYTSINVGGGQGIRY